MKRTIAFTTAAILSAASLAGPAYALDAKAGGQVGAGAQVGGAGNSGNSGIGGNIGAGANVGMQAQTDDGTTGSIGSDANLDSVISAMRSGESNATAIQGMSEVSSVTVVKVDDLAKGDDAQALETAMSDNEKAVSSLQAAIEANADLKAELAAQSVDSSNVVAANVEANGALTVYVR
jgi:hypothetical protein